MKTLFIMYYRLDIGGIQTKIIDIVNYLQCRPDVRTIIILREKHSDDRQKEITNKNVILKYYPDTTWSKLPFFFPIYCAFLGIFYKPSAILAFTFIPEMCAMLIKIVCFFRQTIVIFSEDWSVPDELNNDLKGNLPILRKFVFNLLFHHADAICTVNEQIEKTLRHKYKLSSSKIIQVSNWFSPKQIKNSRTSSKIIYDLLYVGRLEKVKNVQSLLESLRKLKVHKKILLCIVGTGSQEEELKHYIENHKLEKSVIFMGFQSNVKKYFSQSSIFVFPSLNEGLPLSVLEAMHNRLPILSFGYPGAEELIKNGVNGYIYNSEKDFIRLVKLLLGKPVLRRNLGNKGYSFVNKYYSPKNIQQYIELLQL